MFGVAGSWPSEAIERNMIRPWIFEFFPELGDQAHEPESQHVNRYFERYLDLWTQAEKRGFEGIFFSEHHFGGSFSASPNLLIAALAPRTRSLRLGVMGMVLPYYHPSRVVEEIGLLDHLTGGRLEIGTALGVPQELARLNISMAEARERNDEIIEIIDAASRAGVVSYRGKHFAFSDLRPLPRPLQKPWPPTWVTVISAESARKAARRGAKICTGFNATSEIRTLFDAYRDEAQSIGTPAAPDYLALRRRVAVAATESDARRQAEAVSARLKRYVSQDPRVRQHVPDAPLKAGGFSVSDDEFITGTPRQVAEQIIEQCRAIGAGHFLAVLHWGASIDEVADAHHIFAREVIPRLRAASL
jgi:alkanesulfonate monooxygenase SsuD/methylene tetrahydromethanopterin reductase-like flavin-dependent oxidoreductase (luciferase family)